MIESNGVRLCPQAWAPLWSSLAHVVRNAIDHGLEPGDARTSSGKPEAGKLVLRTRMVERRLHVEIEDDGRGIAWERVAEKARAAQLPHATRADLVEALFADGVSTRDEITELSGRGVGMAAVREVCRALGGEIVIDSEPARGSVVRCVFPEASVIAAHGLGEIATRRIKQTMAG